MDIKIHAIHFDMSSQLEAHATKKINKLEKMSSDIQSFDVFFKLIKPETAANKEAEVKLQGKNMEFFAAKVADTFEEAIDTAVEAIEKQIIKHKEKLSGK